MKFDIILPSIGRDSVHAAIESVLAQDYEPGWNLHVYAQGTDINNDPSLKTLPYAYWYDMIVRNDHGAHARNCMISYGKNPWIAYIDDDDVWLPNHLSTLAELAAQDERVNMLSTAGQAFSWKHKSPRSIRLVRRLGVINDTDILTVGMAHTRELFKLTQGWQPCDNHDKLLWEEMLAKGGRELTTERVTFQFER